MSLQSGRSKGSRCSTRLSRRSASRNSCSKSDSSRETASQKSCARMVSLSSWLDWSPSNFRDCAERDRDRLLEKILLAHGPEAITLRPTLLSSMLPRTRISEDKYKINWFQILNTCCNNCHCIISFLTLNSRGLHFFNLDFHHFCYIFLI